VRKEDQGKRQLTIRGKEKNLSLQDRQLKRRQKESLNVKYISLLLFIENEKNKSRKTENYSKSVAKRAHSKVKGSPQKRQKTEAAASIE
jgi:hypothetical protein